MFPTSDEHHVISAREFVGLGKQQGKTGERGPGHLRGVSKLAEPRLDGCADAQQLEALERHDFSGGTSRQEPRATVVAAVGSGRAHQGQQHVPQHPGAHTHTPTHTQPTRPPPHPLPQLARSYDDIPNPEVVDTTHTPHQSDPRPCPQLARAKRAKQAKRKRDSGSGNSGRKKRELASDDNLPEPELQPDDTTQTPLDNRSDDDDDDDSDDDGLTDRPDEDYVDLRNLGNSVHITLSPSPSPQSPLPSPPVAVWNGWLDQLDGSPIV